MTDLEEQTVENLDGIFEDETTDENPGAQVEQEPESKDGEPDAGEVEGAEQPEGKEEAEPPAAKEEKLVPIVALHNERRKAKEAMEELERLKARYEPDEEAPDPVEDPKAYGEYVEDKIRRKMHKEKVESSRNFMIESHADYEEAEKTFLFMAHQDPELAKEMNKHPDPARFAYEKAKQYEEAQLNRLREKILAESGAPEKKTSKADERKAKALGMPDLTSVSSGSNSGAVNSRSEIDEVFAGSKL